MEQTIIELRRRLAGPEHEPRPVQRTIPIAVGAMTSPGLPVAAEHADIVAFSGLVIRLGSDPPTLAEDLAAEWGAISPEQLLDTPFVLLARDPSHAAEILHQRREQFGFDSVITHQPNLEALGQVIAAVG